MTTVESDAFLSDVQSHLAIIVEQNGRLGMWRQPLPLGHLKVGGKPGEAIDTVIVGLRNDAMPDSQGTVVLTVTAEDGAYEIVFKEPAKPSWSQETSGRIANGMAELHRVANELLKI